LFTRRVLMQVPFPQMVSAMAAVSNQKGNCRRLIDDTGIARRGHELAYFGSTSRDLTLEIPR
jgi:hypothetical protein